MGPWLREFAHNQIFWTVVVSWVVSQTIKVTIGVLQYRRFDFKWLIWTGGMPSSHAAGVTALAMAVGIREGFDSVFFAIALVVMLIIAFDSQGVRRAAGRQAQMLNRLLEDIYYQRPIKPEEKLKEFLGHTPVQVIAGMVVGFVVAVWRCR
ncbi:MAG: divergent PAP2 family protein [Candidatus Omnitrophica bacterium]|nr:divergent PAP2 family protein [Candidatus Omnitrophota bacterium]